MGKRYAINIGCATVDNDHYIKSHPFEPATKTAKSLQKIFKEDGFYNSEYINSRNATRQKIVDKIIDLKGKMIRGDLFVLSFSGHTQKIHPSFELTNSHKCDQGWQLYDGVLFHFEIWNLLKDFKKGVRITIICDSCYSDTIGLDMSVLDIDNYEKIKTPEFLIKNDYNSILKNSGKTSHHKIKPSVVILSSTSKDEIAATVNSKDKTMFITAFEKTWANCRDKSLNYFFNELTWNMNLINAKKNDVNTLDKVTEFRKNVTPIWHYHQGAEYTGLRSQSPLFKNKNL